MIKEKLIYNVPCLKNLACMVNKSINGLAPDYLSEMFTKNSAYSRKNLRNMATDLQVPPMKTCKGSMSFLISWCWGLEPLRFGGPNSREEASSFKAFKDAVKR